MKWKMLELKCKLEVFITQREAMVARNKSLEMTGDPLAYGEEAFGSLANKIEELGDQVSRLGKEWRRGCESI